MIYQCFAIQGVETPPAAGGSLALTATPDGHILSGTWPEGSLAEARAEVHQFLKELPAETKLWDLLSGHEQGLSEGLERLSGGLRPGSVFTFHQLQFQGLAFLQISGFAQFGECDVLLEYDDAELEGDAHELLHHLARYRIVADKGLDPGDPIPYGYWLLSLASTGLYPTYEVDTKDSRVNQAYAWAREAGVPVPSPNFVIEAKDPTRIGDDDWVVGASQALRVLGAQRATNARIGMMLGVDAPLCDPAFSGDPMLCCAKASSSASFFGLRMARLGSEEGGWQFGCDDAEHVHDEASMVFGVLSQMALRHPAIVHYWALPEGWAFSLEDDGMWVQPPGEAGTFRDEGAPDAPPWESLGPLGGST